MRRRIWWRLRRMRTSSRRTRLELQLNLPYQCSRVALVDQSNCFFSVNEEEENKQQEQEEDEIRTTMQSLSQWNMVVNGCTCGPRKLFLSSGGGVGGWEQVAEKWDQNSNVNFHSNAAELYTSAKAVVSFQWMRMWRRRRKKRWWGRRWRKRRRSQLQGNCFFPVNKEEKSRNKWRTINRKRRKKMRNRTRSQLKRRLSGTNLSSENNLPTFQLNAPVVRSNVAIYSHVLLKMHVIWSQKSVRIAPLSLPSHHSSPATRDFQSSISVEMLLWGCHLDVQALLHRQLLSFTMVQHYGLFPVH